MDHDPLTRDRDELFKRFTRALFRRDMGALGVEHHRFWDDRLATRDVYRKPL
jgi:hypothetical protein